MSTIIPRFPNNWSIDSLIDKNELIFTFNTYNEFENTDAPENMEIKTNFYKRLTVSREDRNIKFKEQVYTLNGFYLTSYSDNINGYEKSKYYFILETKNNSSLVERAYMYLSIPIIETDEETEINKMLNDMVKNTSSIHRVDFDFNELIPNEKFFHYNARNKIFNVERNVDWILFPKGKLSAKTAMSYFTSLPTPPKSNKYISGLDPLSISSKIPRKVDYIQGNIKDDGIYIDCSPVDDINDNDNQTISFYDFNKKGNNLNLNNEYIKYFIIFIIGLIIIIIVLNIGKLFSYLFITKK